MAFFHVKFSLNYCLLSRGIQHIMNGRQIYWHEDLKVPETITIQEKPKLWLIKNECLTSLICMRKECSHGTKFLG